MTVSTSNSQLMRRAMTILVTNKTHLGVAIGVATFFWIVFNVFDQLLFFTPILEFYLPADAVPNFILSNITSVLLGMVVSMNLYVLRSRKGTKLMRTSFFSGTSLGMVSGACASCTSLGFLLVSAFGASGAVASNVLSNFQIPLRIVSVILLVLALYSVSKAMNSSCKIPSDRS